MKLGSAAGDGQMAKSTWKYKWVCSRRTIRIWLMGAMCHGHGPVMQEEGAPQTPTLLKQRWFASPQGSLFALTLLQYIWSLLWRHHLSSQVKFLLLNPTIFVLRKQTTLLSFPVQLQQLTQRASSWLSLYFHGMNAHENYSKGIIFLTAVFSWITDLESADFN